MSARLYIPSQHGGDYSLQRFQFTRCRDYAYQTLKAFAAHNNVQISNNKAELCKNLNKRMLNDPDIADLTSFRQSLERQIADLEDRLRAKNKPSDSEIQQLKKELRNQRAILNDLIVHSSVVAEQDSKVRIEEV